MDNTPLCTLDLVLTTADLARRTARMHDHVTEERGVELLHRQAARDMTQVLQQLVEYALFACQAHSSGLSLLDETVDPAVFRWHATAGAFAPFRWGTMPRGASPCGTVLDRNAVQLMTNPGLHYEALREANPRIAEALLVPFHRGAKPIGTVWVLHHTVDRLFDAADVRLMTRLAGVAARWFATPPRTDDRS